MCQDLESPSAMMTPPAAPRVDVYRDFQPPTPEHTPANCIVTSEQTPALVDVNDGQWRGAPERTGSSTYLLTNGPEYDIGATVKVSVTFADGSQHVFQVQVIATH